MRNFFKGGSTVVVAEAVAALPVPKVVWLTEADVGSLDNKTEGRLTKKIKHFKWLVNMKAIIILVPNQKPYHIIFIIVELHWANE